MSLDSLANAISIGTLMAFNVVNAGVVILRYSTPNQHGYDGNNPYPLLPTCLVGAYLAACFVSAMGYIRNWPLPVSITFSVVAVGLLAALCIYHLCRKQPQNLPETFKCPLVPLVPCVGIAINSYMLAGLEGMAWIRLGVWLVIGLLIYFTYGIRCSKMRLYYLEKRRGAINE